MGYGSGQGVFNVGIVETDVQAIIDGLTGSNGQTLTELEYRLANVESELSYNGNSAAALLQWVLDSVSSVSNYLGGSYYGVLYDGTSAVTYLNWISSNTGNLGSYLYDGNSAASYLNWISGNTSSTAYYLNDGNRAVDYLNWISSGIGNLQSYLGGSNYGVLYDGNSAVSYLNWIYGNTGSISGYLWSGNASMSVADLLNDIRSLLWNFQFDGNGRLLVSTN